MATYVLYCLEGSELVSGKRIEAEDDDAAIDEAARLRGMNAAELWCDARRVMSFAEPRDM